MQTAEIGNSNCQRKMKRRLSRSPLQREKYDSSIHRKGSKSKDKKDVSVKFSGNDSGHWPDTFEDMIGGRSKGSVREGKGRKEGAKDTDNTRQKNKQGTHDCKVAGAPGKHRVTKVPWVPPPLPEHLRPPLYPASLSRHQRQVFGGQHGQLPQNQFQNDGSFLETFQKMMRETEAREKARPVNDEKAMTISRDGFSSQVLKRRISKVLKTGMVQKKKKNELDHKGRRHEAKGKDMWSSYMNEVHKYSANKCFDTDADTCRPLMK